MKTFKDYLAADISTFINPNEFADIHIIDDKEILCVIEDIESDGSNSKYQYSDGLFINKCIIYIQSNLIKKPIYGQLLNVDGNMFTVTKAIDENGMFEIHLEGNES